MKLDEKWFCINFQVEKHIKFYLEYLKGREYFEDLGLD